MTGAPYIHDLTESLRKAFATRGPRAFIIGVAGGVAAGKTTFAEALAAAMRAWPEKPNVEIVSTDGFLYLNSVLAERELSYRKGFPESYDVPALQGALAALRAQKPVAIPLYSHVTYDVDPVARQTIARTDVAIVDGLHLGRVKLTPDGARMIDTLIYLDAEEPDIEHWFRARLFPLMVAGRTDPSSFYYGFREMDDNAAHAFVSRVWAGINLPNLREHIVKDRDAADVVLTKARDHGVIRMAVKPPAL
jgi:type I pantothenate kinase